MDTTELNQQISDTYFLLLEQGKSFDTLFIHPDIKDQVTVKQHLGVDVQITPTLPPNALFAFGVQARKQGRKRG